MADQTYVFIDGAYVEKIHREVMRAFFGVDGELDIFPISQQAQASRVYFYDSIDYARSANESETNWQQRVQRLENALDQISGLPGFFVRRGTVPGRDKGKKREQKEIDVMIAVDMVEHALKGNIKKAVLIAGDLDFRPAVEALVEEGVAVEVWYHASSAAPGLAAAADKGIQLRFRQLYSWSSESFKKQHRIPSENRMHRSSVRPGEVVRMGSLPNWNWPVELNRWYQGEQTKFQLWIHVGEWDSVVIRDDDRDLIERYVATQYGPILWESGEEEIREMQDRADAAGKS